VAGGDNLAEEDDGDDDDDDFDEEGLSSSSSSDKEGNIEISNVEVRLLFLSVLVLTI
jgi:hypothetical protein